MLLKEFFAVLGFKVDRGSEQKFDNAIKRARTGLLALGAAGSAVAAGMAAAVSRFSDRARELSQASEISGIPIERLQELEHAASLSELKLHDLTQAFGQFNENIVNASKGTGSANEDFRTLGVRLKNANGTLRTTDEILLDVADSVKRLGPNAERTAAVLGAFGEDDGRKLLPFLAQGREGIKALNKEARDLGLVFSSSTVETSIKAGQEIQRFKNILSALADTVAVEVLPDVIALGKQFIAWFRANRDLVRQNIAKFISIISTVGSVLLAVMKALSTIVLTLTNNLGILAAILGGVLLAALLANLGTVILITAGYVALGMQAVAAALATAAAWAVANLPFIALAALLALLILIVEDVIVALEGGDSVIGSLIDRWKGFRTVINAVKEAFDAVGDTIFGIAKALRDATVAALDFFGILPVDEDARIEVRDLTEFANNIVASQEFAESSATLQPGSFGHAGNPVSIGNVNTSISLDNPPENPTQTVEMIKEAMNEALGDAIREAQAGTAGN